MPDRIRHLFALLSGWVLLAPATNHAAITTVGQAPATPINTSQPLEIGTTTYGLMRIDGGSQLVSTDNARVGLTGVGYLHVMDVGSLFEYSGLLLGGIEGVGAARVENGAAMRLQNLEVGRYTAGVGNMLVTGAGSTVIVDSLFANGTEGSGTVAVMDGGIVYAGSGAEIGVDNGSGVLSVHGAQSLFKSTGLTRFGVGSQVRVADGGRVDAAGYTAEFFDGRLDLDAGSIVAQTLTTNAGARIEGDGVIQTGPQQLHNRGTLAVAPGDRLELIGPTDLLNSGDLLIVGGELHVPDVILNDPRSGADPQIGVELRDGTIHVAPGSGSSRNAFRFTATGGSNHFYGSLRNEFGGVLAVTNQSELTVHEDFTNLVDSTVVVMPGSRITFAGGLDMQGGTLLADIAGTETNTGYGIAEVVGDAILLGSLSINLSGGFVPQAGDEFVLLTASGEISSAPALGDVPLLANGLSWRLEVDGSRLVASVVSGDNPGDFNGDLRVDAIDYAAWREGYAMGVYAADGILSVHRNYGASYAPPAPALAPEPAAVLSLVGALALAAVQRR